MNKAHYQNLLAKRDALQRTPSDKYIFSWLNEKDTQDQIEAIDFIEQLVTTFNIPLDIINTTDFEHAPVVVVIGISYTGKMRDCKRFSYRDMEQARAWYDKNVLRREVATV
jgi:hypothetical protein